MAPSGQDLAQITSVSEWGGINLRGFNKLRDTVSCVFTKQYGGFNFSITRTVRMYLYNTSPTASYFPLLSGLSSPRILAEHIKVELKALECTFIRLT